nr:DUF551 domain-containing protein [Klebsiella pneumoniae]
MTKSTITREQLEEWVAQFDEDGGCDATDRQLEALIRQSLAAMDSEPVAEVVSIYGDPEAFGEREIRPLVGIQQMPYGTKLYRHAQPAPVVSADLLHSAASAIEDLLTTKDRTGAGVWFDLPFKLRSAANAQPAPVVPEEKPIPNTLSMYAVDAVAAIAEVKGWNACRAAMLDAEPVTMANKLPDDFDFDRFNDVTWLECVASNPHMHSPTTSTIARVALELNKRIGAGNSPAQSDCCPAQNHVSPEQNGDTPAQSQGWIQVSERMPPSRHEVLVGRWWGEKPLWCCKWATYIPGHPDAQSSGWLIPGASWTPTHWMPLPAAPQEVGDA